MCLRLYAKRIAPPGHGECGGNVDCYRYPGPMGHKPLDDCSTATGPIEQWQLVEVQAAIEYEYEQEHEYDVSFATDILTRWATNRPSELAR